jgi:hypothetical protein
MALSAAGFVLMLTHPCDGLLGCFLGNRTIQGEPAFTRLRDLLAIRGIRTQPAVDRVIKNMDSAVAGVITGSPKASVVLVPLLFLPLPLTGVPYFLTKRHSTNREAYIYIMAKHMAKWTEAGMVKEAATTVLGWLRAACTLPGPSQPSSVQYLGC